MTMLTAQPNDHIRVIAKFLGIHATTRLQCVCRALRTQVWQIILDYPYEHIIYQYQLARARAHAHGHEHMLEWFRSGRAARYLARKYHADVIYDLHHKCDTNRIRFFKPGRSYPWSQILPMLNAPIIHLDLLRMQLSHSEIRVIAGIRTLRYARFGLDNQFMEALPEFAHGCDVTLEFVGQMLPRGNPNVVSIFFLCGYGAKYDLVSYPRVKRVEFYDVCASVKFGDSIHTMITNTRIDPPVSLRRLITNDQYLLFYSNDNVVYPWLNHIDLSHRYRDHTLCVNFACYPALKFLRLAYTEDAVGTKLLLRKVIFVHEDEAYAANEIVECRDITVILSDSMHSTRYRPCE